MTNRQADKRLLRKTVLGDTGLTVSEVGFGGIPLTRVGQDEAVRLVRRALELGFNFFDTARMYGDSEAKLGAALEGRRDQVVLASKTIKRQAGEAAAELAASLENLRTGHLELYQLHNLAQPQDLEEVLAPGGAYQAAARAKAEGRVKQVGFSSHHPEVAIRAIETGKFATVQFACNFVEDEAAGRVFAAARERGMGCIAMKPLGGGLLERADLCFRWLQGQKGVVPIPGIQTQAEAEQIAALYARRRPLNGGDRAEMARIRAGLGSRFCHRCGYCLPCPNGVEIPSVLLFSSQARRFPPQQVARFAGRAMAGAGECTACGECGQRCPYELPIPEMIAENLAAWREFAARHGLA